MMSREEAVVHFFTKLHDLAPMDVCSVGVIDFKKSCFKTIQVEAIKVKTLSQNKLENDLRIYVDDHLHLSSSGQNLPLTNYYFDLASLTKPLTNSLSYFLRPDYFNKEMLLCLNHRGGLPAWGLLSAHQWREQILSYSVHESDTLYSDFSSLRVMLELEKKDANQFQLCSSIWDHEVQYWLNLSSDVPLLQYGTVDGHPNLGQVHDPNARHLKSFCTHAGLFATIGGLCRTLIRYNENTDFIFKVKTDLKHHSYRFSYGWDRVEDFTDPLAGKGCGPLTFGHLGFTGTSIWIDPDRLVGHVILTNATKFHWFDKNKLNLIRRTIGAIMFQDD